MFAESVNTDQYCAPTPPAAQPGDVRAQLGVGDTEVEPRDVAAVPFEQHRGQVVVGVDQRGLVEDGLGAGDESRVRLLGNGERGRQDEQGKETSSHVESPPGTNRSCSLKASAAGLTARWRAGLQLARVLRLIVMALRLRNQATGGKGPLLVPFDANVLAGASGPVFVPVQIQRKIA